jgi:hypothetical protein
MSRRVEAFARQAEVREELHPYDLRGNTCSMLLTAGCSLAEIALFIGDGAPSHARIATYASLDPALRDSILGKLAPGRRRTHRL